MVELTIGNSMSKISGLTAGQHQELSELMSFKVDAQQAYFSGGHRARTRTLLGKRGDFPTGLLYLVNSYLAVLSRLLNKPAVRTIDTRVKPPIAPPLHFIGSKLPTPYREQTEASEAALERYRGIVVAPTGVGKSVIAALICQKLGVKTLIVVPTLELKRQLIETFRQLFGIDKAGDLGDSSHIAIENVAALDPRQPLISYDCVIIDEFHHSGAKTYRELNKKAWENVFYRFGLTATPFRSDSNERILLESVLSEVIYRVEYQTSVNNGYIVPLEAYYVDVPKTNYMDFPDSWPTVYNKLIVNNEVRNDIITKLITKFKDNKVSTLCLVKEIAHGELLSKASLTHFANGQDDDTADMIRFFNEGKLQGLIGTTGVLGEGVDTRPAEVVIIAGLGKSKNAFMQQCGRAFRRHPGKESAKVILFRDVSHKWTKAHFAAQVKYLREEYGVRPAKIEV